MTFRNTAWQRALSGILVIVMVFTMVAELVQPISAAAPTLQLKKISNVYDSSIYVTGTLKCTRADKISAYGLLYGEKSPEENKVVINSTTGKTYTGTKSISKTISGMTPGKSYVCCLYAETTDGKIYKSETMTFTSSNISIAQLETKNITYNSMTVSAVYTRTGSCPVKEVGFYYGTDKNCTKKIKASKSTKISARLQNLESGRTYYYYAYVLSEAGNLYKSEIQTFQTLPRSANGVTLRTSIGNVSSWKNNPVAKNAHLYDEFRLEAEIRPDYAQNKNVTFSSSNPDVIQINGSRAKAVAPGKATITATAEDGGFTASLLITVKDKPEWDEVPVITSIRADGEDSVTLNWKRPSCFGSDDKVIYVIYRSDKRDGNYEEVAITKYTSETDDTLDPGTTYFYKIQAYEKSDDLYEFTYFSDVVSVTTKEHVYIPKNKTDKNTGNSNVIAPDPVQDTTISSNGSNVIAPDPVQDTVISAGGSNIIAPDPVPTTQNALAPKVSGLAAAYTIEKGGKLSLRFTVEDAAGGIVEKVTVKHNVTNSTCTSSLTNNRNGVMECVFDITNSIFNTVGTYNFNVYAKTTNFTVTDNRIGSFTVTVIDKACQHKKYNDLYNRTEYTDVILTDAKHTSCIVYDRTCKDCGVSLGEINGKTQTAGHTVNKKGYCDCGYIDVSGYTQAKAYNKTGSTQNVYRNPESRGWYGSIGANENVTILGEWGDRYLIEYSLDGGGVKQGYVPKSSLQKHAKYSMCIDDKYYYNNILECNKLLVAEKYNYYQVKIYNETIGKYVSLSSDADLELVLYASNGMTIGKTGTLCVTPNDTEDNLLQLYYSGELVDSIYVMCCTDITRYSTLDAISDSVDWEKGNITPNSLMSMKRKSLTYSNTNQTWNLGLDFYNYSFTNSGIASYYANGEMYEFHLIDGRWEDFGFAEDMIKCITSVTDIPHLITGNMDKRDSDFFGHTFQKTSVQISIPKGGYVKLLCSNESDEVLFANITDMIIGFFETSGEFKALMGDLKLNDNLRNCIDRSKFSNKVIAVLNNYNMLGKIREIIIKEEAANAVSQIISILSGNENAMKDILAGMTECMASLPENVAYDFANKAFDLVIKGDKKHVFTQSIIAAGKSVEFAGIIKFTAAEIMNGNTYSTHGILLFAPN